MKAGRIVGRVGGLAVALGVGAAVSLGAPAAWADDTGPASSDGATGSADGAEAQSRSAKAETTADPASPSTTAGSESNDAATPESGTASESPTSVPTGSSVRQAPPGIEITTGGAQSSTESNSEAAANDDPAVDLTTDEPAPESDSPLGEAEAATATAVVGDSNSSNRQKRVDDPTGDVKPLRPKASPSPTSVAGVALQQPAQPAATAVEAVAQLEPQANVVAQADAIAVEPAVPPSTLSTVVLAALGIAGWGSPAPDNPLTPVDSPLELALLALGARSRSIGQSTDDEQAVAMAAVVNSAPSVPAQPVGTPDPVTGVVTGVVIATDPDNDTLIYTVASGPAKGTLELNSQTGAYTYTPTPAARMAAGTTPTADTDSFAVAVSDGQQTTTASVSVYISPIRVVSQAPIAVGTTPSAVVVSADGRMFVANTGSMTVSVINTVTGQRIDANSSYWSKDIAVEFSPSALALSADGKRLYVANTGSGTVSVIDATTYKRIDVNPSYWSKDIQVGSSPSALAFGSDGRLYVANRGSNTVSVIDTVTNKLVDTNPNITGTQSIPVGTSPSALALSPDGRL